MNLNREKYEEYFLDYLEGKLDEKHVDEFLEFLHKNPDLKEELKNLQSYKAEADDVFFPHKEKLYKEKFDSPDLFLQAAIGVSENDLNDEEIREFEAYVEKHPDKKAEFGLYKRLKLVPDETIVFENRKKLLKQTPVQRIGFYAARIAAVLILAFSVSILLKQYSEIEVPQPQIVKFTPPIDKSESTITIQNEVKSTPQKELSKPEIKETIKAEPVKSIRENTQGRVEGADFIALNRDTISLPYLAIIAASYNTEKPTEALATILRTMLPQNDILIAPNEEVLLADKFIEKTGLDKFRLNDITKAGLKLFSSLSKNKFNYDTNDNGDITELNLDTRLLAFSIPTHKSAE